MNLLVQRILASVFGAAAVSGDGPWRARTVLLALLVVVVGLGFWVRDAAQGQPPPATARVTTSTSPASTGSGWDFTRPVPGYVRVCASYVGGFFIGWAFRRFIRLALAVVALVVLLVGLGKCAGCNPVETDVKERATWVKHEATAARDYLKGLLPSTSAGAVGTFLGFRRKDRRIAQVVDQPAPL